MYRNKLGRYTRHNPIETLAIYTIIFGFIGYALFQVFNSAVEGFIAPTHAATLPCAQTDQGEYSCSSESDLKASKEVEVWYVEDVRSLNLSKEVESQVVQIVAKPKPTYHASLTKKYSQKQLDVAHKIIQIAKVEKFDRISYLLALADCESSFNPSNKNTKGNSPKWSTDLGTFMYNDYHQRKNITKVCSLDLNCSTKKAIQDIKAGRQSQWVCDGIIRRENRLPRYSSFLK